MHKQPTIAMIQNTPGLIAFWDFQEEGSSARVSRGGGEFRLRERGGTVPRVADGVFGDYAAKFGGGAWLEIPRAECGVLNIGGHGAQLTILAWVKRAPAPHPDSCQAVAGMWNEYGRRQYALFLNLQIHNSAEQVGAHLSATGDATPGFDYCMDAAIGQTPVAFEKWQCAGLCYGGQKAVAYLNGAVDARAGRNPWEYSGGVFDGGEDGADFTVGAVARPENVQAETSTLNAIYGIFFTAC